ncbi:MAG: type III toxin-antitoxin system ToxN/AbiQ family toxin [Bacilli bacterium]|nr:type III toxin-antitoxin system ToxN/AbiQ family toxin [Bacilli bacterium]
MSGNMNLVIIDTEYCDYLRKFDCRVPYNKENKDFRPFVGVLFRINDIEYFAPLSSPKPKHLKMKEFIDFIKIDDGNLGIINLNNMIPVTKNNYKVINYKEYDSNVFHDMNYYRMQQKELLWLNRNKNIIISRAYKLYTKYMNNKLPEAIRKRCCDFKLLEEKCDEYNKVLN